MMASNNYTIVQSDQELATVLLFSRYSESLLWSGCACCVVFMLIGIPGNLITIIALATCRKVRNATAIYIINLHISDLIFNIFIMPLTAMTFAKRHWPYGLAMCHMFAYSRYVLVSSSIFTIVAITINRYVIVCYPLLYPKLYKRRNMSISILMIWASALAIFMPPNFNAWGQYGLAPNSGFCTMMPDRKGYSPKLLLSVIGFVGPCLTIAVCYAQIWWVVRNAKKIRSTHLPVSHTQSDMSSDAKTLVSSVPSSPGSASEDRAFQKYFKAPFRLTKKSIQKQKKTPTSKDKKLYAMIAAITISFSISHLPVLAEKLIYKDYMSNPYANVVTHLVEYLGTCMNPIIYVLMSKEYRQAYKSLYEAIIRKFQRH